MASVFFRGVFFMMLVCVDPEPEWEAAGVRSSAMVMATHGRTDRTDRTDRTRYISTQGPRTLISPTEYWAW